jgi:hypothetical protein
VLDGQDLRHTEKFCFSYQEINHRLNAVVPPDIWESQTGQRMSFYEKVDLAKPSKVIQDQIMLETLDEANEAYKQSGYD